MTFVLKSFKSYVNKSAILAKHILLLLETLERPNRYVMQIQCDQIRQNFATSHIFWLVRQYLAKN